MQIFSNLVKFLSLFCLAFVFSTANAQISDGKEPGYVETKTYRFPGGMCVETRYTYLPNVVMYITTLPELMTEKDIDACISSMNKKKWEVVMLTAAQLVDNLREARTQNMACAHVGVIQMPMMYQVKFANFAITGKQDELRECMSKSAEAPNRVQPMPMNGRPVDL